MLDDDATPPVKVAAGTLGGGVEMVDGERFDRIFAGDLGAGGGLFEQTTAYNTKQPVWYNQDLNTVLEAVGSFLRVQTDALEAATGLDESLSEFKL